jgi:hypothetical protein
MERVKETRKRKIDSLASGNAPSVELASWLNSAAINKDGIRMAKINWPFQTWPTIAS